MSTPPGPPQDPYDPRYQQGQPPPYGYPPPGQGYPPPGQGGYPPPGQGYPPPGQGGYPGAPPAGYPQQPGYPPGPPSGGSAQQPGYPPPPGYPQQGYGQQPYPQYPGGGYGAGQPTEDPLVPADLGGWFQKIIGVVQRSFVPLLILQAITAVVSILTTLIFGGATANFDPTDPSSVQFGAQVVGLALVGALIAALVSLVVSAASVYVAVTHANGEQPDVATALRFAPGRLLPLIGWGILAVILVTIGIVLLILPGIYLICVFAATFLGVVVIERGGMGRMFTLFNNRFGPTLGRMLLLFVIGAVFYLIIGLLVAGLGGGIVGTILTAVIGMFFGIVGTGVTVVTYAELRFHDRERPGTLTPQLAAELRQ